MIQFELLLMRHAQAEEWAQGGDAERILTPPGRKTAATVGRALKMMGLDFQAAVVSPFRRARETAGLVMSELWFEEDWPTDTMLTPSAPPSETVSTLVAYASRLQGPAPRLFAVGHNPNITSTLGQFLWNDPRVYFNVAPADVAHLWVESGYEGTRAAVLGFYPARMLERLTGEDD